MKRILLVVIGIVLVDALILTGLSNRTAFSNQEIRVYADQKVTYEGGSFSSRGTTLRMATGEGLCEFAVPNEIVAEMERQRVFLIGHGPFYITYIKATQYSKSGRQIGQQYALISWKDSFGK